MDSNVEERNARSLLSEIWPRMTWPCSWHLRTTIVQYRQIPSCKDELRRGKWRLMNGQAAF